MAPAVRSYAVEVPNTITDYILMREVHEEPILDYKPTFLTKKLFPTMNIQKVRIFNIENRKCANVRKLPAGFVKDTYS